jgi:hypothetical protein
MKLNELLASNGITKQVELNGSTFYDVTDFLSRKKTKGKNWMNRKQQKDFSEVAFRYKKGKVFFIEDKRFFLRDDFVLLLLTDLDLELRYNLNNRITLPNLKHNSEELLTPSNDIKDLVIKEPPVTMDNVDRTKTKDTSSSKKDLLSRLIDWIEKKQTIF